MKKALLVLLIVCFGTMAFAQEVNTKHRIGAGIGFFSTTGGMEGLENDTIDFESSASLALDYSYMYNQHFAFGAFLDFKNADLETTRYTVVDPYWIALDGNVVSVIIGPQVTVYGNVGEKLQLFGTGKLGIAFNTLTAKGTTNVPGVDDLSSTDDGREFAFILEAGLRYRVHRVIDLGVSAKYIYNPQKFGDEDDYEKVDLGGLGIMANIGFNF